MVLRALVSTSYFNAVKAAFVPLVTVVNTPLVAVARVTLIGLAVVPSPVIGAEALTAVRPETNVFNAVVSTATLAAVNVAFVPPVTVTN